MNESRYRVFVYGTLRSGGSYHHHMAGAALIAPATVTGRLYRIDWYPGVILDPAAGPVTGEIHEVDSALLAALDDYEGSEYRRVETEAALPDGTSARVWIWEWRLDMDESRRIPGGDWLEATLT